VANVAVQIPEFTTNTMRRCKVCAVLADQHSDAFSGKCDARAFRAYLENPVAVRSRTSKNVKMMAIRTSTATATQRDEEIISCPPNGEVISSGHGTNAYYEERSIEHKEVNNVYAGSRR